MNDSSAKKNRRISVEIPDELVARFDELKKEWGLRGRGAVVERLLEELLADELSTNLNGTQGIDLVDSQTNSSQEYENRNSNNHDYDENTALVLIASPTQVSNHSNNNFDNCPKTVFMNDPSKSKLGGIDLPGFVSKKSKKIKESLRINSNTPVSDNEPAVRCVTSIDIEKSLKSAISHWNSLYGNNPGENVVEAAMIWLAREIWLHTEGADNGMFTWSSANHYMKKYCKSWVSISPSFERVMVVAGVLEDPFATHTLPQRMPTLIRRFVNSYKRSNSVTSFETLESTMTVHGALKLLGLPTIAGSAVSLARIRDAYKSKAVADHPDAGGSTEAMRRLNEAYQLLKELYRKKE